MFESQWRNRKGGLLHSLHGRPEGLYWIDRQMFEALSEGTSCTLRNGGVAAHTVNWPCLGPQQVSGTGLPPPHHQVHHKMSPGQLAHSEEH